MGKRILSLLTVVVLMLSVFGGCSQPDAQQPEGESRCCNECPDSVEKIITFADTIAWDGEYDVVVVGVRRRGRRRRLYAARAGAKCC